MRYRGGCFQEYKELIILHTLGERKIVFLRCDVILLFRSEQLSQSIIPDMRISLCGFVSGTATVDESKCVRVCCQVGAGKYLLRLYVIRTNLLLCYLMWSHLTMSKLSCMLVQVDPCAINQSVTIFSGKFLEKEVSFDTFHRNPSAILNDCNLVFKIDNHYLNWQAAAAAIVSLVVFKQNVTKVR